MKDFTLSEDELQQLTHFSRNLFLWVTNASGRAQDDWLEGELVLEYEKLHDLIARTHFEPQTLIYMTHDESKWVMKNDKYKRAILLQTPQRVQEFANLACQKLDEDESNEKTLSVDDFAALLHEFAEQVYCRKPKNRYQVSEKTIKDNVLSQVMAQEDYYRHQETMESNPLIKTYFDRGSRMQKAFDKAVCKHEYCQGLLGLPEIYEAFTALVATITFEKDALAGDKSFFTAWYADHEQVEPIDLEMRSPGALQMLQKALQEHRTLTGDQHAADRTLFFQTMEKIAERELCRMTKPVPLSSWQEETARTTDEAPRR